VSQQVIGGLIALASAASWSISTILWCKIGEKISPFSMNLSKGIIGSLYLLIVLLVIGFASIDVHIFLLLGISGLLGITLADTFYFMSLKHLGPRLTSLMGALFPVSIVLSAVVFLGEKQSLLAWIGIFLTIIGVVWVLAERIPQDKLVLNKPLGIRYSLLSIVCTTAGIILAKIGVSTVPPLQATFIRLFWGVAGLVLWGSLNRQLKNWIIPFKNLHLLKNVSLIVLIGTFGGFWFFLLALKYLNASIASTLNSTVPLFMLAFTAILLKEKISLRAVLATFVAVCGVAFIFIQ
jgi:drug/metabolite transporter (DMT)-like permease